MRFFYSENCDGMLITFCKSSGGSSAVQLNLYNFRDH